MKTKQNNYINIIEKEIDTRFSVDKNKSYNIIQDAMRYSMTAGGKRIRPMLVLEFAEICGGNTENAMPFAIAIEMIHTYSLIHDDLPCMDNDDMRRGKPTNHKVYGEAMAVLAGDALLTEATGVALSANLPPKDVIMAADFLRFYAGIDGMIGGQVIDLTSEGKEISIEELEELQTLKTGALLELACKLGCIAGGKTDEATLEKAEKYGYHLGRAFQIQDDILDVIGDSTVVGKSIGKDEESQKATYPAYISLEECKNLVKNHTEQAINAISVFENKAFLCDLANSLINRNY